MLNTIFNKAPLAISYVLETVNRGLSLSLEEGIRLEADYFGQSCASDDMKEGTGAFLEKRKPEFKGN